MILIDLNEKISLLSNQLRVKNMELKKNEEFLIEYELYPGISKSNIIKTF